jgi:mono/diheme cytochrome c family protein
VPEAEKVLRAVVAACAIAMLPAAPDARSQELVERGRYLTTVADCEACHTDPAHPQQRFGGGRVIETPFGKLAAPNITPDRASGIGGWSDQQFEAALRRGVRADGKRLYPAMPYVYYTRMSADDVRAIRAYLQTIPAVRNAVKADRLPFPLSLRILMRIWDALYFTPGEFKADGSHPPQWNRGAYLVRGPGHCAACHTPKNALGGDQKNGSLDGYTTQGWFSPDLTEDEHRGLADWTQQDIAEYLKRGHNRYAGAAGPMAEEISFSSSQMSDSDLLAIAQYLKSEGTSSAQMKPLSSDDPYMVAGAAIYQDLCSACHAPDGHGVAYLIPDLAASNSVASREPTTVLRVLLQGSPSVATPLEPTGPAMPGFAERLSDLQLAAVATYIRNSWGHSASALNEAEVRRAHRQLNHHAAAP